VDKASEREPDRLITPAKAAGLFGVDPRTLRRWHQLGLIGARRTLGGQRRYRESEVRALIAAMAGAVNQ
jgi:DNA-binding transcriptional MerR regulator